jgi:RsiW-degrading membrane proteinase PrsW (M82 family)
MGYGFVSLLQSKGNLGVLDEVLLVRGLSSPAGHMSWTGMVCAILWNTFASLGSANLVEFVGMGFFSLLVALLGLVLLIRRVGEVRRASAA